MGTVVAQRDVEVKQNDEMIPGRIQVFTPQYHPEDEDGSAFWKCEFHLDYPGGKSDRYACGEDSFQALQLALGLLPVEIESSTAFRNGNLYLWGERVTDVDRFFSTRRLGEN